VQTYDMLLIYSSVFGHLHYIWQRLALSGNGEESSNPGQKC